VNTLLLLDLQSGKSTVLASGAFSPFFGWSPDGARALYSLADGVLIADMDGNTVATLPSGWPSWSLQNEILIGTETDLSEMRPDGTGLVKLADGTFNQPVWSPDSTTFSFVRGGSLWTAQAPAPVTPPTALDQATTVVNDLMLARLSGNNTSATKYLDADGQAAFGRGGATLIPAGETAFSRFYILTSEVASADSNATRFVVRLVFAKDKVDVSQLDETLTLTRREATDPFLVHGVEVGKQRQLGQGPEVVSVDITQDSIVVTFDSDLNPTTVPLSVTIRDARGKPLTGGITSYSNHKATISGLQLIPGTKYTLAVLPSLRDVGARTLASEYDLVILGPQPSTTANAPLSSPSPSATP
jgi:hypothetical protein